MRALAPFLNELSSDHTRRAYKADLSRYLDHLQSRNPECTLEDATATDVQQFLDAMKQQGQSESTRRRRLSAVRRLYDWLVEKGDADRNPARASTVTLSREPEAETEPQFLSKDQLEHIVAAAGEASVTGPRDRAIVLVVIYGALRRGDLAALDIADVRPLARHWVVDLPGGPNSRGGFVKVPSLVADAVQRAVDTYDADEGPLWQSFSNRNRGQRMSPDALYKRVRRLGRAADVEGVDIETLRRSGLRLASKSGARLDQIQSHARLQHPTSALRYMEADARSVRLQNTAGDFLDLDVDG